MDLQSRYERARAVMRVFWRIGEADEHECKNVVDDSFLVAADALDEASLHNDAAWLRYSFESEVTVTGPAPNGPFVFIGHRWVEVPEQHPALALETGGGAP